MCIQKFSSAHLENNYDLLREIRRNWKKNPNPILQETDRVFVTSQALQYAIICRMDAVIDLAMSLSKGHISELNQTLKPRNFTALHIAVISDNFSALEKLVNAGVVPHPRDVRGWTPLHHAALLSHLSMMEYLISHGANRNLTTSRGATADDIWTLSHLPTVTGTDDIWLMWQENDKREMLTQAKLQKLTHSTFIKENLAAPQFLWEDWHTPKRMDEAFSFAKEFIPQYQEFRKNPPLHNLKRVTTDSQGRLLPYFSEIGLFASKNLSRCQVIGEYRGEYSENPKDNVFVLGSIDATLYRNDMPFMNDGFGNVVGIIINDVHGLPKRSIFITTEMIKEGDQLVWNYGGAKFKRETYCEIRAKEIRTFITATNITEAVNELRSTHPDSYTFETVILHDRFRYILDTPSVLFSLIYENLLKQTDIEKIMELDHCNHEDIENHSLIIKQALASKKIKEQLTVMFPKIAKIYDSYLKDQLEKEGVNVFINITNSLNISFSIWIKQYKNLDAKALKEHETQLISCWNNDLLLKIREYILKVKGMLKEKQSHSIKKTTEFKIE